MTPSEMSNEQLIRALKAVPVWDVVKEVEKRLIAMDGMIPRPKVEAIYNFMCNELAEPYETGALIQACTMLEEALGMDDAKEGGEG